MRYLGLFLGLVLCLEGCASSASGGAGSSRDLITREQIAAPQALPACAALHRRAPFAAAIPSKPSAAASSFSGGGPPQQVAAASARLSALLEPVLIIFMAVFVGFVLLATILPILEAGNVL